MLQRNGLSSVSGSQLRYCGGEVTFALLLEQFDDLVDNFLRFAPPSLGLLDSVRITAAGDDKVVDVQHFSLRVFVVVPSIWWGLFGRETGLG